MTTIWFAEERLLRGELAGELQIFETIFQLQKFIALLRRVYGEVAHVRAMILFRD